MRTVKTDLITKTIKRLCLKANIELRKDILLALKQARKREFAFTPRYILGVIVDNAGLAKKRQMPICQDTGMVVVYLRLGQKVRIKGDIKKTVEKGVTQAYKQGFFRKSIVSDPLKRKNTGTNLPSIIHTDIVPGNKLDVRVVVKGFGCENASRTKMFRPFDSTDLIEDFIVGAIRDAGSKACPPLYIGIGIGGTLDKAVGLSKEAVLRPVGRRSRLPHIARLERSILKKVNGLKIGAMGMGGKTTSLGVSILTYPTHIAGLPVAVNISCHATRDARRII